MVLQRDKPLRIHGQASGCSQVTVRLNRAFQTAPVRDGRFSLTLPPQPAGEGGTLEIQSDQSDTPELIFRDIAIGDVWMACGQSNMEYFLRYDAHWNDTKRLPPNRNIRMYNCPRIAFEGQRRSQEECGRWFQEHDPAWPLFSAPGYSFARELQPHIQVSVGIIGCNWGGTPACAWMDEQTLSQPPLQVFLEEYEQEVSSLSSQALRDYSMKCWQYEDSYRHGLEWRAVMYGLTAAEQRQWMAEHAGAPVLPMGPYHHYRPAGLYHTMIEKIAPFSIRGFLWYQGESDSGHAEIYDQTMKALIACFRRTWEDESLPFLFVQLAPFGEWLDCTGENYRVVRERQEIVSKTVPNTGMISIMDLGDKHDIHPKFKMEVGRRLALLARGTAYGEELLCQSPEFSSASLEGRQLTLTFSHAPGGLTGKNHFEEVFSLTQQGNTLEILSAEISQEKIILTLGGKCQDAPLLISFAQKDYCQVSVWNQAGLPIKPFSYTLLPVS